MRIRETGRNGVEARRLCENITWGISNGTHPAVAIRRVLAFWRAAGWAEALSRATWSGWVASLEAMRGDLGREDGPDAPGAPIIPQWDEPGWREALQVRVEMGVRPCRSTQG